MSSRRHFAVVTDSSADLTPELAHTHDILVVPLSVTIGDETFEDGALTQTQLFERIRAAQGPPTTSQPSMGALVEAYGQALETAESVIALHISSQLSSTFATAELAAAQFDGRVHVFDSRNLSWGLGWQVVDAATASREGLGVPQALARLEQTRERVRIVVSMDSLEALERSGRISAVTSRLGSLLNLKVTVAVDPSGAFVPVGRSRGDKAALTSILDWIATETRGAVGGKFAVGHALAAEKARSLAEAIGQRWDVDELIMYEAGSVIAAHAGTIWGVAVWPRG